MRNDLTEIICILDASGSMGSIRDDMVGGFNTFIEEQKKLPGEAKITVIFFDSSRYIKWQDGVDIKKCPILGQEYRPLGGTPLLDAVGRTINEVGARLAATPESARPGKVVVLIVTDGEENSSHEFTLSHIKQMVQHQESKYSWTFSYLGANVDSFCEAASLGIQGCNTSNYTATPIGVRCMFSTYSNSLGSFRSGGKLDGLGGTIPEDPKSVTIARSSK